MATTTETGADDVSPGSRPAIETRISPGGDVVSVLHIGPRGLDHYLRAVRGQSHNPLIKCDGRSIQLVSPGSVHERAAEQLDMMVIAVVCVLGIPSRTYGSTFYRLPEQQKGVMPDKSYYFQNVELVRKVAEIDLRVCPPPDLVIEVAHSHAPASSIRICRALRVPEVWVYDVPSRRLSILLLEETGEGKFRYVKGPRSRAMPFLGSEEISPWADRTEENDGDFNRRARAWVEAELAPRQRALHDQEDGG